MVVPVLHAKVQRDIDHSKLPTATAITFIFRAIYIYIYIYQPENMRLGISHFPWNNSVTDCCWKWNICRGNQIKFIFKWQCLRKGAFVKNMCVTARASCLDGNKWCGTDLPSQPKKRKKKKKPLSILVILILSLVIENWNELEFEWKMRIRIRIRHKNLNKLFI